MEAEIGYEVLNAGRDDHDRALSGEAAGGAGDAAEGGAVEVVHVGVGKEDEVDGGEAGDGDAGTALAAEQDKAGGEDGVDKDVAGGE